MGHRPAGKFGPLSSKAEIGTATGEGIREMLECVRQHRSEFGGCGVVFTFWPYTLRGSW